MKRPIAARTRNARRFISRTSTLGNELDAILAAPDRGVELADAAALLADLFGVPPAATARLRGAGR